MKIHLSILLLCIHIHVFAQQGLSKAQVLEDYTVFKRILTTAHPSLPEYTTAQTWDSLFQYFETKSIHQITDNATLFRAITALADRVKDGHLMVHHSKRDSIPEMFPLWLKIIDQKCYTDTDDFGIPLGSEIISIDGKSSLQILQKFLKYAPADGYNLSRKYRQIEKNFGIFHYYEYGTKTSYVVNYRLASGIIDSMVIIAQPFDLIGARYPNKNSHYAPYHQNENKTVHFQSKIVQKQPFVYYIDSIKTAVLTINSFALDPPLFKSILVGLFKDIKKKKAAHLIIDIRQNSGGFRINAIHLFSFLSQQAFQQRIMESAVTDVLPEQQHILHTLSDYSSFFATYFANSQKEEGRWILKEDHAKAEMIPYKKPFSGKIYVLIGGTTFSAGSAFALSAKNTSHITLVGEETGGGYYFHTGQYPVLYQLPNSKIVFSISFVKIDKFVLDKTVPIGSGILPDLEISLTLQDLIRGKDTVLDTIIQKINKE